MDLETIASIYWEKDEVIENFEDLTGKKYGRLTVLGLTDHKTNDGKYLWKCICDCQKDLPEEERKYTYARKYHLEKGIVKSCGCWKKEQAIIAGKNNRRTNKYDLSGEYGIGWTSGGYKFIFDLDDYDKISKYCWHQHQDGYLRTCYDYYYQEGKRHNKYIMMHQLVFSGLEENKEIDHINGKPWDNRKENLRSATHFENMRNVKIPSNNKSGHKGVYLEKNGRWKAMIRIDGKPTSLGVYKTYEEAVKVRELAEEKYYKEFNRAPEDLKK